MLVLVHAGVHFNAILGWLAIGAMLINVGSGLTGKFLVSARAAADRGDQTPSARRRRVGRGIERAQYWDSLTYDVVKRWRDVHFPIALAFAVLAGAHIFSTFLFWGWR